MLQATTIPLRARDLSTSLLLKHILHPRLNHLILQDQSPTPLKDTKPILAT